MRINGYYVGKLEPQAQTAELYSTQVLPVPAGILRARKANDLQMFCDSAQAESFAVKNAVCLFRQRM